MNIFVFVVILSQIKEITKHRFVMGPTVNVRDKFQSNCICNIQFVMDWNKYNYCLWYIQTCNTNLKSCTLCTLCAKDLEGIFCRFRQFRWRLPIRNHIFGQDKTELRIIWRVGMSRVFLKWTGLRTCKYLLSTKLF